MVLDLLLLGFVLSWDNARTAIVLGARRPAWRQAVQVALVFGLWDAVAPAAGILAGHYVGRAIASEADYAGAAALAAYGLYLVVRACTTEDERADGDRRWMLLGLPLPLSADNVVAGASVGLLGVSPWLAPPLFGVTTAVVSLAGLQIGRAASRLIRVRSDLLAGMALVLLAVSLAVA